ncbi:unnamed protein product [Nippostrongylus brasiliensis]|uniref:Peptidase S1 domain-containing protein n=1 Tax=Nippostrongylus brasiliensis TaxID=27835 RepID=A0A0N4Y2A6_NIPBR|nr:unnamed protein product [Nippostrongylus brasiliensis]
MYQHDILRVFVIITMKRYLLLSAAYRLPLDTTELIDDGFYRVAQKKSLDIPVPEAEHVCPTTIMKRHRPLFGHMGNGSYVEVQQDSEHHFETTFVECTEGHHRPQCHGIDTVLYSSECVTLYEWRSAFVRLPGLDVNFIPAKIKVASQLADTDSDS